MMGPHCRAGAFRRSCNVASVSMRVSCRPCELAAFDCRSPILGGRVGVLQHAAFTLCSSGLAQAITPLTVPNVRGPAPIADALTAACVGSSKGALKHLSIQDTGSLAGALTGRREPPACGGRPVVPPGPTSGHPSPLRLSIGASTGGRRIAVPIDPVRSDVLDAVPLPHHMAEGSFASCRFGPYVAGRRPQHSPMPLGTASIVSAPTPPVIMVSPLPSSLAGGGR